MKWNKSDLKILLWPVVVIIAGAALYLLTPVIIDILGYLTGLLLPFIIGYVISKAINPLADILQKRLHIPRGMTVILVILCALGIIVGLVYWGASSLSGQAKQLFTNNPDLKEYFVSQYSNAIDKLYVFYNSLPETVRTALDGAFSNTGSATNLVMDYAGRFFKAMPNVFVSTIVGILSLYFMVTNSASLSKIIGRLFKTQSTKTALVWAQVRHYLGGYLKAQLIIMSVTATIMSIWFIIIGVRYWILIALGIALLDALPIFGSGLILWPWSVMSFLNGDPKTGFCLILVYASIALTRHLIEPKLVSTNIGMNPLVTLMSMYIGYRTLSVGGLIAGPLIMLLILSLYKGGIFDTPIAIVKQVFKKTGRTLHSLKEYILSDDSE